MNSQEREEIARLLASALEVEEAPADAPMSDPAALLCQPNPEGGWHVRALRRPGLTVEEVERVDQWAREQVYNLVAHEDPTERGWTHEPDTDSWVTCARIRYSYE